MGFDAEDIIKLMKLTAIVTQGLLEIQTIINNKQAQEGKTELEIAEHAEQANKEARALIEAL